MFKKIMLACGLLLLLCAADKPKMVKVKLTEKMNAMMPENFRPMEDNEIAAKYFTYRKPLVMYTDTDGVVDFGLNVSTTQWKYSDLDMLRGFYKASIMQMYTEVRMEEELVEEINKCRFVVFRFASVVRPTKEEALQQAKSVANYTHLMYTIVDEKVYVLNFTCPYALRDKWIPVAQAMMKSVKVQG